MLSWIAASVLFASSEEGAGLVVEHFHYVGPFLVLLLCGLGLPLPEEITLLGAGILVHQGEADFAAIALVCAAAILIGDSIPYWLGRHFGQAALRIGWVARVLHPERFAALERRFAAHGNWVVFTCRFLPGVRIPGYFVAGTLGMGYARFLTLDGLGVLLSVPLAIWLGILFGDSIERMEKHVADFHLLLAFLLVSVVLVLATRHFVRRRLRRIASGDSPPRIE